MLLRLLQPRDEEADLDVDSIPIRTLDSGALKNSAWLAAAAAACLPSWLQPVAVPAPRPAQP